MKNFKVVKFYVSKIVWSTTFITCMYKIQYVRLSARLNVKRQFKQRVYRIHNNIIVLYRLKNSNFGYNYYIQRTQNMDRVF